MTFGKPYRNENFFQTPWKVKRSRVYMMIFGDGGTDWVSLRACEGETGVWMTQASNGKGRWSEKESKRCQSLSMDWMQEVMAAASRSRLERLLSCILAVSPFSISFSTGSTRCTRSHFSAAFFAWKAAV